MRIIATVTFPTAPAPSVADLTASIEKKMPGVKIKKEPDGFLVKLEKGKVMIEVFDPNEPGGFGADDDEDGDDEELEGDEMDEAFDDEFKELFGDDPEMEDPFGDDWDGKGGDDEEDGALFLHISASKKARPKTVLQLVGVLMSHAKDALCEDESGFPIPVRKMLGDDSEGGEEE